MSTFENLMEKRNKIIEEIIRQMKILVIHYDIYEIVDRNKLIYQILDDDEIWKILKIWAIEPDSFVCKEVLTINTPTWREIENHNQTAYHLRNEIKAILFDIFPFGLRELIQSYIFPLNKS